MWWWDCELHADEPCAERCQLTCMPAVSSGHPPHKLSSPSPNAQRSAARLSALSAPARSALSSASCCRQAGRVLDRAQQSVVWQPTWRGATTAGVAPPSHLPPAHQTFASPSPSPSTCLQGFGCRVLAYDVYENEELKQQGVTYCGLEELLTEVGGWAGRCGSSSGGCRQPPSWAACGWTAVKLRSAAAARQGSCTAALPTPMAPACCRATSCPCTARCCLPPSISSMPSGELQCVCWRFVRALAQLSLLLLAMPCTHHAALRRHLSSVLPCYPAASLMCRLALMKVRAAWRGNICSRAAVGAGSTHILLTRPLRFDPPVPWRVNLLSAAGMPLRICCPSIRPAEHGCAHQREPRRPGVHRRPAGGAAGGQASCLGGWARLGGKDGSPSVHGILVGCMVAK